MRDKSAVYTYNTIPANCIKLIKKIEYSELTKDATLYFSKSSNFPRLKLENTGFKRCIKLDKADFVVINPSSLTDLTEQWYAIETDTTIYLGSYWTIYRRRTDLENFLGFTISSDMMTSIRGYELSEKMPVSDDGGSYAVVTDIVGICL